MTPSFRTASRLALAAIFAAGACGSALAERLRVAPGDDLAAALARAAPGDVVVLAPGDHRGRILLDRPVGVEGEAGATLTGSGQGSVVTLRAPGSYVRGLAIRGSGGDLVAMDSGVFIEQSAVGALVEANRIEGNLYGVFLHGAPDAIVRGNVIVGRRGSRVSEFGNGVSVWNAPGGKVIGNDISSGRDGIFSAASRLNTFSDNRFFNTRFAVHYMYTNESTISGNVAVDNNVGYAVMYSNRLKITGNVSDGDRDNGFLFNYANGSQISGNAVIGRMMSPQRWLQGGLSGAEAREHGVAAGEMTSIDRGQARPGPGKCVFIYNANQNRFADNWFEGCDIGIHFTAGSERNDIVGNAFVRNRNQVKYVGTRYLDWSKNGRGNFWSDNPAFDLDRDGIADAAYRPNDLMDKVLWTAPQAKALANSPAVQVLRWAQSQFPALLPGGVVDRHPLMVPPPRPARASEARR